jgi:hypothetical protein
LKSRFVRIGAQPNCSRPELSATGQYRTYEDRVSRLEWALYSQTTIFGTMSFSYRTDKRSRLAARRIARDSAGNVRGPRIVQRRPYRGDVHPLDRQWLRVLIRGLPIEYLYGLKRIELRARNGEAGLPYGEYARDEKVIRLYSLPLEWCWYTDRVSDVHLRTLRNFDAEVSEDNGKVHVRWTHRNLLAWWFYAEVFVHELGHHHRNQYRFQNQRGARWEEEMLADIHGNRLWRALRRRLAAR